ncbi:MAG: histidine--tRNA ligase [Firmicutes bacterium]|nr:histidine--tRNA ligase [Bacillota bacterium]
MEKFKPSNIKGAIDTLPSTQILRNHVTNTLKQNFEAYGYLPIETAFLNNLDVLTYKYDQNAEIVREIYKIRDQGERDLGLRFDLTVPFSKFIATNRQIKMPFRRYEIGKVFRNGPVKTGRLREFYQCDIDVVGTESQHVEAEIIALAVKCYLELGIVPVVKYNNRKFLTALIEPRLKNKQDIDKVIGTIDKIDKISEKEFTSELLEFMTEENVDDLCMLFVDSVKSPLLLEAVAASLTHNSNPIDIHDILDEGFTEILKLKKLLTDFGVEEYCHFTPSLARGLNVYTSTVFEVVDKQGRIQSAIGAGGRYDNIITDWIDNGLKYPAVGFSFGLEAIMALLGDNENNKIHCSPIDMLLVSMDATKETNNLANNFRSQNKRVLVMYNTKIKHAFEYANKENIPFVAVIGEKEIKAGEFKIKDMATGIETKQKI